MSDVLAWVSFALQVYSMVIPVPLLSTRTTRTSKAKVEINLGFYRKTVTWTETRNTRR